MVVYRFVRTLAGSTRRRDKSPAGLMAIGLERANVGGAVRFVPVRSMKDVSSSDICAVHCCTAADYSDRPATAAH